MMLRLRRLVYFGGMQPRYDRLSIKYLQFRLRTPYSFDPKVRCTV